MAGGGDTTVVNMLKMTMAVRFEIGALSRKYLLGRCMEDLHENAEMGKKETKNRKE